MIDAQAIGTFPCLGVFLIDDKQFADRVGDREFQVGRVRSTRFSKFVFPLPEAKMAVFTISGPRFLMP